MKPRLSLIVAMAQNRVMGRNNQLPWHLPEDLKYFRKVTRGHPVIMGRKTYESIGRLLPERTNIILTRQSGYEVPGAKVVGSLSEAISGLGSLAGPAPDEIFVIGGAQIYEEALPFADRIYLTLIHQDFEGDTFFPKFEHLGFKEVSREDHLSLDASTPDFSFLIYEKTSA